MHDLKVDGVHYPVRRAKARDTGGRGNIKVGDLIAFDPLGRIITYGNTRAELVGHLRRILARR